MDLTGNIHKLSKEGKLPKDQPPRFTARTLRSDERGMAFDAGSWAFWTLIIGSIAIQFIFLAWLG